jgi:hypothetical protein
MRAPACVAPVPRYEYFRGQFPKVTVAAIEAYSEKYRLSEEEAKDVLEGSCRLQIQDASPSRDVSAVLRRTNDPSSPFPCPLLVVHPPPHHIPPSLPPSPLPARP